MNDVKFYYNERKTKIITLLIWMAFIPLNIYFFRNGIYGEKVEVDLLFIGKQFVKDTILYDLPFLLMFIFGAIKYLKHLLNKDNNMVIVSKKASQKNYLQFAIIAIVNIIIYFAFPSYASIFLFISIFGLSYIVIYEGLKELLKKEMSLV